MDENKENNNLRDSFRTLISDLRIFKIAFQRLWNNTVNIIKCIEWGSIGAIVQTKWFRWACAAFTLVAVVVFVTKSCSDDTDDAISFVEDIVNVAPSKANGGFSTRVVPEAKAHKISNVRYAREFNDLNDTHLAIAKKIGIKELASREDAANASRTLVEISANGAYEVDDLTHSIPFLIPEAAALLNKIGENFQDSLAMKHMSPHKVIVTSVLRTKNDIKRLRRRNTNSSENSVHCYGTTIDITYKRFLSENGEVIDHSGKLKLVLGEVLRDLKKEGCCYVKHEKKQACFHITVRKAPK